MTEIPAAMVMKLRKMSGQGMMDCKKALQEAAGDMEQAMSLLRKMGLATLSRRAERETTEGLVISEAAEDGRTMALATLCCETDFVARSDDFAAAAEALGRYVLVCPTDDGAENLLETTIDGRKYSDILTEAVSKIGEKIQVGDYARYKLDGSGLIEVYVHFNSKVGTMVQFETSDETVATSDGVRRAATDIAMHITAIKPLALDRDGIDAKTIEQEKAVFAAQVKDKPANIIDKIVEGKLRKFFAEHCLVEQQFVKDTSKSVSDVLAEAGKQAGGEVKIKRYVRFEVG